jgi:hypothetical protein
MRFDRTPVFLAGFCCNRGRAQVFGVFCAKDRIFSIFSQGRSGTSRRLPGNQEISVKVQIFLFGKLIMPFELIMLVLLRQQVFPYYYLKETSYGTSSTTYLGRGIRAVDQLCNG